MFCSGGGESRAAFHGSKQAFRHRESAEPIEDVAGDILFAAALKVLITSIRSRTKSRASSSKEGTFWCVSRGTCSNP